MASFFAGINARIRAHPVLNYVCSTHFWGPVSNFGIPIAAVLDTQKDAKLISGQMTGALVVYSLVFMRYAVAVTPKNYLLFACHFVNEGAQLTQGYRYLQYNYWGGNEARKTIQQQTEALKFKAEAAADKGKEKLSEVKDAVKRS